MLIKTYSLEEFNQAKLTQGTIDIVLFDTITNRKIKTFTRNEFENDFYHSDIANFRYNDDRIWEGHLSPPKKNILHLAIVDDVLMISCKHEGKFFDVRVTEGCVDYKPSNSTIYKEIEDDRNYGVFFDDLRFIRDYVKKMELPQILKDRVLKIINL